MSATKTASKETAAQKKARLAAAVVKADSHYLPMIEAEASTLGGHEQAVALSRVVLGRLTLEYSVKQLANGVSSEAVQASIIGALNKPTGGDYAWGTVENWQAAAMIEDTLAETSRGILSEDSLRQVGWFPEEGTPKREARQTFVDRLISEGTTGNRAVRSAVKAVKPVKAPKSEPTTAEKAQAICDGLGKAGEMLRRSLTTPGTVWNEQSQKNVTAAVLLGVMIGHGRPFDKPSDAEKMAAKQLSYFGPLEDDSTDDQ